MRVCACLPARARVSSVPVADADTLDKPNHARVRVYAGVGGCVTCKHRVPLWGAAALSQRSNRLQKFLSFFNQGAVRRISGRPITPLSMFSSYIGDTLSLG